MPENLANQPKKLRLTLSFDNICKYLAAEYPAAFVHWLLNIDTNDIQILPTALKLYPIHADTVILLN